MSETVKLYGLNKLRETLIVAESTRRSMQGNRSKDTKPEVKLRKALWGAGLRGYRKNVRRLPGTPDVVFGRAKVVVFVHGCFWHGHGCPKSSVPQSNRAFWTAKIDRNRERFSDQSGRLEQAGYAVMTVWECDLRSNLAEVVERVRSAIAERQ